MPYRGQVPASVCGSIALVVALSCESPFEPRGQGERVPIGRVIEDQVSGDTAHWYSFSAAPNQLFVVFLAALQGTVQLIAVDSTHQTIVAEIVAGPSSPAFEANASNTFGGTASGAVYRLRVNAAPYGSTARFRFQVYVIDQAPEHVPAAFTFGDTVTGETIDPMVDIDQFIAHGDSGQEIVAVAETPGPAGSGAVGLIVIDPVANTLLGYVFADAATSNPLTTGRMRLSGTHDYRFGLASVTSNTYPRYRGPYRFWTYVLNRTPEHRAPPIPLNTEIGNERIDRAGDVDEFTFQGAAGDDYNAFVQGAGRTFQLEVAPRGGATLAIATSQASDTALFAHSTNRFQLATAGAYVVRVTGTNPYQVADTGAYRIYLYKIDRRPEHVPETIAPGDTVIGEDIALPGDVDEFTFSGATGEEFNAFLQAENGSLDRYLQLEVVDPGGAVVRLAQSVGSDTGLLGQPTGRFALTGTGIYRLRVSGAPPYGSVQYRGPYRLFLYRVNRAPEALPDTLAFGDSLSGEAIDVPGDLDEFRVTVPDSSGANLLVQLDAGPPEYSGLSAQLINLTTGQSVAQATTGGVGVRAASGRVRLGRGSYILRVDASQYEERSVLRGSYHLWLYRFGFGPEAVSDTFAVGDTVSGEAIEPLGDIDEFHFHGLKGQHVNIALQGLAAPSGGGFQAFITGPTGYSIVFSGTSAAALHDHQTLRVDLPATGWYELDVSGAGWSDALAERGAYRFAVEPLGAAPERVGSALVPGDSVTTEAIDSLGDWDEYTVSATPGQDLGVIVRSTRTDFLYPQLRVFDRATGDSLAQVPLYGERLAGPFRVPAAGQVGIAVYEPDGFFRFCYDATCGGVFRFVGAYAFRVISIDRAPESVPQGYAVGDTVRGEAIFPAGDIDEFTSSGTPGDTLSPWYRLTASPVPPSGSGITLEVIDPATGVILVGWGTSLIGSSPQYYSPGYFVVPPAGTFLIRVRGSGLFGDELETAPYEFFVKRGP